MKPSIEDYCHHLEKQLAERNAQIQVLREALDAVLEHMNVPGWCEFDTNEDATNYHNTAILVKQALAKVRKPT